MTRPDRRRRRGARRRAAPRSVPWSVGVLVPARDEAPTITACVDSIRVALRATHRPGRIVVVADSCTDDTVHRARQALGGDGEVLLSTTGRPGAARRLGADHLLARGGPTRRTWLATTDADTTVPPDWLSTHLAAADAGAAAVAGIVVLGDDAEAEVAVRHRAVYEVGSDGTHPHVHGANLGVRADAYLDAGGWSPLLAVGEDHHMWARLCDRGWPVTATARSWVTTSGRSRSRVDGGFASDLAALITPGTRPSDIPVDLAG